MTTAAAASATFFASSEEFHDWLEENHESESELWVGFHKRATGRPSMTWSESVDQALCFGWIDGVRRSLGDESYAIRFTPRKPGSTWSKVNVAKMEALKRQGRVRPVGLRAYERRSERKTGMYSYEQPEPAELSGEYSRQLRANARAREHFESRPPWYRRAAAHWVMSATREQTRLKRLATLIECSERGQDVPPLRRR
ncbi:MAG: YdeI family protein [Thermoleophilaceae bacterium]